ncbi:RsmB/NOP family class I SAM-dependent RNA methyltransferase [Amaricoccus tamworthensis]|uniref:RsmB/NOP family class I SAM-dependent RNA methyltransferase n=1 Tax=Amaricoccus tamworthensis TaxID=57002 RepID=UPI003C799DF5
MSAPGFAARRAAAGLLAGVLDRRQSLADQLGDSNGPLKGLEPSEKARAQSLASGVLRHLGRTDAVLAGFLRKQPPPAAMNALRIACVEMNVDGVPAHAAVDGAVRLANASGKARHLSGLVNAVARKVAGAGAEAWDATPEGDLPDWLSGPVSGAWGAEALEGIVAAHTAGEVPVDLTLKRPGDAEAVAAELGGEVLPTGSVRLRSSGQISKLPGYDAGAWWVQDAAAAIPARMFGDLTGRKVLDLCAAPGGKTMRLAAAGGEVAALDMSKARLKRLRENLDRTGLKAGIVSADAIRWQPPGLFDAILLDAPCSATGTVRRHPDLPYVRQPADVGKLRDLQKRMLKRAWEWLAPGGRMVYCTCSLLPAEGETQARRFVENTPDAEVVPVEDLVPGFEPNWSDGHGGMRLRPDFWPERGGMDGFYAVMFQKNAKSA